MRSWMLLEKRWIYLAQATKPKGSDDMEAFHIVLKDFANWKMENIEILERFKSNRSLLYDRLEPVYVVLNHIYESAVENQELNEDYQTIFQVGLNYLHTQFEVVKVYYEKLFESDCELFESYTSLVGYLLFISDFRADLEEYEDELDCSDLSEVETMIENMVAERDERFSYAAERLNNAVNNIKSQLDFDYISIIDIFLEIADNLNLNLPTRKPFVIGKDI